MLDLTELEQLVAFADCGTLSKAAEMLHISQPTITRTMKHLEEAFGVPLFIRGKNKICFNETGEKAAALARSLLADAKDTVRQVQAFDQSLRTIMVESCAPAPLWLLLPALSSCFPDKTISSRLEEVAEIIQDVRSGACELGILPCEALDEQLMSIPFVREELSVCLPKSHDLAGHDYLTFAMLNGFNCLLRSQIGFWDKLCCEKMPSSRFLVQNDEFELKELIRNSSLPCFSTNLVHDTEDVFKERKIIPITDPEANVTYRLVFRKNNREYHKVLEKLRVASLVEPDRKSP